MNLFAALTLHSCRTGHVPYYPAEVANMVASVYTRAWSEAHKGRMIGVMA